MKTDFVRLSRLSRRLLPVVLTVLGMAFARAAMAIDYGALSDGTWTNVAIWNPAGGPPGNGDRAFIGTTYPGGAGAANVSLGGDQTVDSVFLGYAQGTNGTLNLAGHALTVNSQIGLGVGGGSAAIVHNGGAFSTTYFNVDSGNSFTFAAGDSSTILGLTDSSLVTTAGTSNVISSASVDYGSKLTLGAPMTLSGNLDLERTSTLDMAGHPLTASQVLLGWNSNQPFTLLNRAPITAAYLEVGSGTLNLNASDNVATFDIDFATSTLSSSVSSLYLSYNSKATTTPVGNVEGYVGLDLSSSLTMGAAMTLTGNLDLERSSTLDMAGHPLTAFQVLLGWNNNQPYTLLNRAPIMATYLQVGIGSFNLSASDNVTNFSLDYATSTLSSSVSSLTLSYSSQATTTPAGNVTGSVGVDLGSTLTMGAPMTLTGNLDLERSSTLDMGSHPLNAYSVQFSWNKNQPYTLLNRAPIMATYLEVGIGTFNLSASDNVTNFYLDFAASTLSSSVANLTLSYTSQATTTPSGNVGGYVSLDLSSSLTMGAAMTLTGNLDLERSSTLDMAGHPLTANVVQLGWNNNLPYTLLNRAPITATYLEVGLGTFNLSASDNVTNFYLDYASSTLSSSVSNLTLSYTSQATTTPAGNVGGSVSLDLSSSLTMGAAMTLTGNLDLERSSTLDMAGHPLTASVVQLGWNQNQPYTLLNRAPITAAYLEVGLGTFNLSASDNVTNFYLDYAASTLSSSVFNLTLSYTSHATTTPAGNVAGGVSLDLSSSLTLGAPMTLTGNLDLERSSTLNMAGHPLSAYAIYMGWSYGLPVTVVNAAPVTANYLYVGGSVALAAPGSVINNTMTIAGTSTLTLQQPAGQSTGLTFFGSTSAALAINDISVLQLAGGANSNPAWTFRWQDVGGSWESTLNGLIAAGRIAVSSSSGYSVFDDEGYTYVATPSTLIWNGAGGNNNWSTAGNFSGASPTAGHWLRFGALAGGGHTANNNDLAANSLFYGIFFDAAAPSYNLQGNAIQLSGDVLNQSGTNQSIGLNIQLVPGDGAFNTNTIAFDTGAKNITDSGSISGSGMALMKTGSGILILSGTNTYNGGTIVTAGKLIVATPSAILDGTSLTVGTNAQTKFAAPVIGAPAVSVESSPSPVPGPGALSLLAALLVSAAAWRVVRKP